jgi:hypothetical protein
VKSVDTAPGLERLREPGFQKLSKLCCMRSTPTEMQSMNENDFECSAKTRLNTPPMAKMTDDVLHGSYAGPQICNQANEILLTPQKSAWGKRGAVECRPSPEVREARFWLVSALRPTRPVND